MIENRPWLTFVSHLSLLLGIAMVALPVWVALVASTHASDAFGAGHIPLWFGDQGHENWSQVLFSKAGNGIDVPVWYMMINSFIMALGITIGKLAISIISAYAIVFFRFPFRGLAFWTIFITLMLPVEVRIVPTYEVIAKLDMLDSYTGLILPLIASATATFLFRQCFMTVPGELVEAARIDGAGPIRFFFDILLPLSRTNIAALFVIMFIYGWNQYLWPLIVTTDDAYYTLVMSIKRMLSVEQGEVEWNKVMVTTLLAMLPPILVVVGMQKLFVKGLVDAEK
ncbi:sn-glycerol-3-phosphate ABC transporter permease UgpE [Marinomonas mediterranea]|jgi:carbohydrate ABC transporter membrane protein 2, CUT1 family (TC 3.A.1.1.-)|uniref:sn-glycerol-3-phosphate transport system permease protein UgpE n=1 Tax=Marinomonas mediterranea (strain ATCC 700492 / JCM 21426 / NBRC 103028 / MMB-1) TaxID=717774 RepID=F2JVY3_MARM1|nr:sn-glycerol-3-phosphate ABC transporter permease UgpE [Marinomonas mediterranea]ADZ92871.1 ABC-type transporter, integral membrane subunit [Marinomonas mediterranea MMB-1]WCN10804.1 sn-glycerol-3-phosphate ABC transporter permease UgpE [Marinomonas mediterranea]WCN14861.1 sn-glycerol-3-phosphate ABC transporter permease UgpE [Marinomonas mediterranea]WCN18893.1 sn-glycerol-3-phosphate ABC transporter permease UgpE [Marinomonas mediterranea MMB-1]